jgi:hypothetical protein
MITIVIQPYSVRRVFVIVTVLIFLAAAVCLAAIA